MVLDSDAKRREEEAMWEDDEPDPNLPLDLIAKKANARLSFLSLAAWMTIPEGYIEGRLEERENAKALEGIEENESENEGE
jgi:hypothetical protein